MHTFKLSPPILAVVMITLLSLGVLGCDEEYEGYVSVGPSGITVDPLGDAIFWIIPGFEGIVHAGGDVAELGKLLGGAFAVIDPGHDVENSETGDTASEDYPELDLIEFEFSVDENTGEFIVKFTCYEEPAENRFVSGYAALVDDMSEYHPADDPFAALSTYLYFWRMNDDAYAAVMEQTNGDAVVADDSVRMDIDGDSCTLYSSYFYQVLEDQLKKSSGRLVGGTTDGMGHSDWIVGVNLFP